MLQAEKTVRERLKPTIDAATTERDKCRNRGVLSFNSRSSWVLMTALLQLGNKGYSSMER